MDLVGRLPDGVEVAGVTEVVTTINVAPVCLLLGNYFLASHAYQLVESAHSSLFLVS